jgi:hypothetical protein
MTNALAYLGKDLLTSVKSFKAQAPRACAIKLFTVIIKLMSFSIYPSNAGVYPSVASHGTQLYGYTPSLASKY